MDTNFPLLLLWRGVCLGGLLTWLIPSESSAQNCSANILQKDTTVCPGTTLTLTVGVTDSANTCNTYSIGDALNSGLLR